MTNIDSQFGCVFQENFKKDIKESQSGKNGYYKVFNQISNPNNKFNIKQGIDIESRNVVEDNLCTSTPKGLNVSKNFKFNGTLDSGYCDSSCFHSSTNISTPGSSFNESIDSSFSINKSSESIFKRATNKRKESLTRSAKSRKISPSKQMRFRLKESLNTSSCSKLTTKNNIFKRPFSPNSSLNCSIDTSNSFKGTLPMAHSNNSQYFSGSSTQTVKSMNRSVIESSNDSYNSLVIAYDKFSLSGHKPSILTKSKNEDTKWKDNVNQEDFYKVMTSNEAYNIINSHMGILTIDIVINISEKNMNNFLNDLFSYLSDEDLLNFHQVSKQWKVLLEGFKNVNQRRDAYLKKSREFYKNNKENFVKKTCMSFLSPKTSMSSPLKKIQKKSFETPKHSSQNKTIDYFQTEPPNYKYLKCPVCSWASRVNGLKASCLKFSCGLQFCSKCLQDVHPFGTCPQEPIH